MMYLTQEETYGKLVLTQLFTHIWYGEWDKYEEMMNQIPEDLTTNLPFHSHYNRLETEVWHDNYFTVPGIYFIPPYISSYRDRTEESAENAKQDLLCLIGVYEKMGFYYPLEREAFPDHIGSLTAFIAAALKEELAAYEKGDMELVNQIRDVKQEVYHKYLAPCLDTIWKRHRNKFADSFFKAFFPYYKEVMKEMVE